MNILDGIQNFLQGINDNWTSIVVIIGLSISIAKNIKGILSKSKEEQISIAKKQVQQIMLKLISDAEIDYEQWSKAGEIKRSQVIEDIFLRYPILAKVTDQDKLMAWIDERIDESLVTMKEVFTGSTRKADGEVAKTKK